MYLLSSTPNLGTFCLFQKSFNVKTKCTPFSLILTYNNELLVYHKYVDPAFTLIIAKLIMLFFFVWRVPSWSEWACHFSFACLWSPGTLFEMFKIYRWIMNFVRGLPSLLSKKSNFRTVHRFEYEPVQQSKFIVLVHSESVRSSCGSLICNF
jgi:hypothetical protein